MTNTNSSNNIYGSSGELSTDELQGRTPTIATLVIGDMVLSGLVLLNVSAATSVDMQVAKALSGAYVLNEFGDTPVVITLSGVQKTGGDSCKTSESVAKLNVGTLYHKNKLSALTPGRVKIGLSTRETYEGYLIAYTITPYGPEKFDGTSYVLKLVAVYTGSGN